MAEIGDIKSYRDLHIWQRAKVFVVSIYKITGTFPSSEMYGLTNQMRRAAISIPSNIAEGFRKVSKKEKLQFLRTAYGSGSELETQLEISHDLAYLNKETFQRASSELDEIMRMMNKAIQSMSK